MTNENSITPEAQLALTSASSTNITVPVGTVVSFFGNAQSIPAGWFLCNGRQLTQDEINKYQALAAILQPFNYYLPNLGGRTIVGLGPSTQPGLPDFNFTDQGGEQTHRITEAEMPSHNHFGWGETDAASGSGYNWGGNMGTSNNVSYFGSAKTDSNNRLYGSTFAGGTYTEGQQMATSIGPTGLYKVDNLAHNNMQPYYVLSFMICAG
jgi:microcystin-dependent protein